MKKINLNSLYGGSWEWLEETYLFGVKHRSADLDVKPLKDHLKEWVRISTDGKKLPFGCLSDDVIKYLNNILEGRVTTLDNDDGVIKFEYEDNDKDVEENWCVEKDYVVFKPLELIRKKIMDEAREQGVKPPKTWCREQVDWQAYRAAHPDVDELPF